MKGLLAPQNTFLDTIATRFDGTRECGLGLRAPGEGDALGALHVGWELPLPSPPPPGGFPGTRSRQCGGGGERAPNLSRSPAWLLHSFAGEEGARSPPYSMPCAAAPRGLKPDSLLEKLCAGLGLPCAPGSRETARDRQAQSLGRAFVGDLGNFFFLSTPSLQGARNFPKS